MLVIQLEQAPGGVEAEAPDSRARWKLHQLTSGTDRNSIRCNPSRQQIPGRTGIEEAML